MKKLLGIFFLSLFFNSHIIADEWKDIIKVESLIDGFCYYTKKVKPDDYYNLRFQSGSYKDYNLETEESCQDFENFQNSIKNIKPLEAHLPYNGEIIQIEEARLVIKKWEIKSGLITRVNKTKKGILVYQLTFNDNFIDKKYFSNKGILDLHITSKANKPTNYSFYENKKILFEFEINKDRSIKLIKNNLKFNNDGYYQIILDELDFAFIIKNNNIVSKLEHWGKNIYGQISVNFYQNRNMNEIIFHIFEDDLKSKNFHNIKVFENSKKVFEYSMSRGKLTFEKPYKNNKRHGFEHYFSWNGDQFSEEQHKCYLNGVEIDENNLKKINQCKEIKIDRKSYRNIYFNKWGMLKNEIVEKPFNFLDKYLVNRKIR